MMKHRSQPMFRKLISCAVFILVLLNCLLVSLPETVSAQTDTAAADQLEIQVGYSGGTYTSVRTFQRSDLETMAQVKQAYSFIDNMPCPIIDSAIGVKLTDILAACNIDVNNVQNFRFWTTDIQGMPCETLTKAYLLDTPRFYFPHLADSWSSEDGEIVFADPTAAAAGAVQVPTMIALSDNWQRMLTPLQPDYSVQDDSSRFRLMFGKTNDLSAAVPEHTASKSAKWIDRIDVTLSGTAVTAITLNKTSVYLTIGSDEQLTAKITPANATDQKVIWASDNPAVTSVDSTGKITALAEGMAKITATTEDGAKTASCAVTVRAPVVPAAIYTITPIENGAYQNGITNDGITTMTVKDGSSGLQNFIVQVTPVKAHEGEETVVFVAYHKGMQVDLKMDKEDFDVKSTAQASFNIQPGDVVKVYIVNELSKDLKSNPTVFYQ